MAENSDTPEDGEEEDDDDETLGRGSSKSDAGRSKKLRSYNSKDLVDSEITITKNSARADGYRVSYNFRIPLEASPLFGLVVLDDAHIARNRGSYYCQMVSMLNKEGLLWMTGTTLYNRQSDMVAPLMLMWQILGIDWDYKSAKLGDLMGLYHPEYNPILEENNINIGSRQITTRGIFYNMDYSNGALAKMKQAFDQDGRRLWLMCPGLFEDLGSETEWSIEFAHQVLRSVFTNLQCKWTMSSRIELPDGTSYFPGANIPPCQTITEELGSDTYNGRNVKAACDEAIQQLFVRNATADTRKPTSSAIPSSEARWSKMSAAIVNFGAHRRGILYSNDARHIVMLDPKAARELLGDETNTEDDAAALQPRILTEAQCKTLVKVHQEATSTSVGFLKVWDVALNDMSGGLDFFYEQTRTDVKVLRPKNWGDFLTWYLDGNPTMARVLRLLHRYVFEQGRRVLVFCDVPIIQL
jgi:hypothetical protein